ncbi:MAG: amidase [Planctomyces sp.]|nr:amidase [Planctomyces sp.]
MPTLFPSSRDTITGLLSEIRSGAVTPYSLTADALDRIMRDDMEIQAWVHLYEPESLKLASEQTVRISNSEECGPLAGIPIGVKDIIDSQGALTGCGFPPFLSGDTANVASKTAPLIERLISADAIILGKTTTTQFACFDPTETRNPWSLYRTPGGSSSGSAAAVAGGMCFAAIGTQTGGSITRPAAYCGVVGFKPGFDTLPTDGIFPVAPRLDQPGFFTRSIEDAQLLWDICRESPKEEVLSRDQLRVGHLSYFFQDHAAPRMQAMLEKVTGKLTNAGCVVAETGRDIDFEAILAHHRNIMIYEAASVHQTAFALHAEHYLAGLSSLIQEGMQLPITRYQQSCDVQDAYRNISQRYFDQFDLLISPATLDEAPPLDSTGDPRFNAPWSFLGLPTITIPVELSEAGLPLGLQLIAPAGGEDQLLHDAILISSMLKTG